MSSDGLWGAWSQLAQLWWTRHGGLPAGGLARERARLLVRYAREYSPFYRERYAALPADAPITGLPPVTKAELMSRFDDWATDRRVRLAEVKAFLADRSRIGGRFLGGYWVWKSSGTTGTPGVFLQDAPAMAVYDALVAAQVQEARWNGRSAARLLAAGRAALVVATGDHFASIASWERMRAAAPSLEARSFSVLEPLETLVAGLDRYKPAFLAGYPSVLELLAQEQEAGRLRIAPAIVWSGGEHLGAAARRVIERAFDCPVMNEYGASECLSIAHECAHGWMHLHSEWVMLEGVERDGGPTPPGRLSHTALLTNLANWAQPIIRYDIGDRVLAQGCACACGSRLPAFRVAGRSERMLSLVSARGRAVPLAPLAVSTVVEEAAGDFPFQVAQTGPESLALRFAAPAGTAGLNAAKRNAARALRSWLSKQSLPNVAVSHDPGAPRLDPASGKLHAVVIENRGQTTIINPR
ncbi:MAG TPA: AMP-binding protein [Usitatibacter sp.]|nr:AMP-binding protein [Usitatibacter sp.]